MERQARGFTLIELIVVIAILGVLAAVALPRFIDLQVSARQAKLNAGAGAVRAGAALFHAQCLANAINSAGACPANNTPFTIAMEGLPVTGVNQYPDSTLSGVLTAAGISAGLSATGNVDYTYAGAGSAQLAVVVPSPTASSCWFSYAPATLSATAVTAPTVTIQNSTCN